MHRPKEPSAPNAISGAGLVALDVIVSRKNEGALPVAAGGSCCNVLSILAWLGWESRIFSRMGSDNAAAIIKEDLSRFGVDTKHICSESTVGTPIIFEHLRPHGHRFDFVCPCCRKWAPRFRPPRLDAAELWLNSVSKTDVFYFDRNNPACLLLARKARERGSLVVFEPSQRHTHAELLSAVRQAHIVKYSSDFILGSAIDWNEQGLSVELVIETLGHNGLRYHRRKQGDNTMDWVSCPAFSLDRTVDTAGAGDWTTAGLLYAFGKSRPLVLNRVEQAVAYAQAFGALSCQYPGARGLMYDLDSMEFLKRVDVLVGSGTVLDEEGSWKGSTREFAEFCPNCPRSE